MGAQAFHEYYGRDYGRSRPQAIGNSSIPQPINREPNRRDDCPPTSRRCHREPKDAPPHGGQAQQDTDTSQQAQDDDSAQSKTYSDEEDIPKEELEALRTLVANLWEEWPELHSRTIEHNLAETVTYATQFANNAMVGYFTNRPPLVLDFKIWVREELEREWMACPAHAIPG